jgi:hypothetical protein
MVFVLKSFQNKLKKKGKSKPYLPKNEFVHVWVARKRRKKTSVGFTGVGP